MTLSEAIGACLQWEKSGENVNAEYRNESLWVPWLSIPLFPFNRQNGRLQLYRQERSTWLSWLHATSPLYWYIVLLFLYWRIGPFLNSEKGNKISSAQNSNISQLCGVLSKLPLRSSWHCDCLSECFVAMPAAKLEREKLSLRRSGWEQWDCALSGHSAVCIKYFFTLFSGSGCDFIFF